MISFLKNKFKGIAMIPFMAMLFLSCADTYKRVGEEAQKKIYPQWIAENSVLTYSELAEPLAAEEIKNSKKIAVLTSPVTYNYDNLIFPYKLFPKGLVVDFFDEKGEKSIIKGDHGIIYSATNLIDLQGNVVIETSDGKILESDQLYYDQETEWIFTQEKFKFTNPEDGTIMDGEGMDFNRDISFLNAHKTYGIMMIKEESDD